MYAIRSYYAVLRRHREAEAGARFQVGLGDGAGQIADAADVGGALGDRDGAAGVEQVEGVRGLQYSYNFV